MRTKDLSSIIAAAKNVIKPPGISILGFLAFRRELNLDVGQMSTNSGLTPPIRFRLTPVAARAYS